MPSAIRIRKATKEDVPMLLEFIRDLAIYEDHLEFFQATEERLQRWIFGPHARAHSLIGFDEDTAIGFAIYYFTFSTFAALPGIYLEDLFVKPDFRNRGVGEALLRELARLAKENECSRIEWAVLHWNETAIRFYKKLGAVKMDEWSIYRLSGDPLTQLATAE